MPTSDPVEGVTTNSYSSSGTSVTGIQKFYDEIDKFASQYSDEVSSDPLITTQATAPSPDWEKLGEFNKSRNLTTTGPDNVIYTIARIDLDTEIWRSTSENRTNEDKFVCALKGEMWPSSTLDYANYPGGGWRNYSSDLVQDWSETSMGTPVITDYAPTRDQTQSIDTSLSVGSKSGATVSMDWNTPYIRRTETSQPDETVGWHFGYPKDLDTISQESARWDHVPLKSVGESWLDSSYTSSDTVLETHFTGEFRYGTSYSYESDTLYTKASWYGLP